MFVQEIIAVYLRGKLNSEMEVIKNVLEDNRQAFKSVIRISDGNYYRLSDRRIELVVWDN